jgi:hypothetical protein
VNPLTAHAWPPGSRRVYRIGVLFWVVIMQLVALLSDLILPNYWWVWHFLALLSGLVIGHITTMRILAIAIQEWKNRV